MLYNLKKYIHIKISSQAVGDLGLYFYNTLYFYQMLFGKSVPDSITAGDLQN